MPQRRRRAACQGRFLAVELLETRALLSANPIGEQFLVDETLSLAESPPAVDVVENTGDFVAAWTSFEQPNGDESGLGVYAQRFFDDGTPNGSPFLVNTAQTEGDQFAPDIAVDAAGDFVVVWQGLDADGAGVFAQRYDVNGTPQGSAIALNDFTTGDQQAPTIAMDNAGNFLVAWQSDGQDGDGQGVYARRFDAEGNPLETQEFLVNTTTTVGNQAAPTAAMARDSGNFVIAWEGDVIAAESSVEIFAQLYGADANPIREEFQVNTVTTRDQVNPNVAMDAAGAFVATWTSEGIPGSGSDVFAQRFDAAGDAAGGEFQVNDAALQGQINSVAALDGDGDFMITWQSSHQDEFSWGIFGRAYDAGGNVLTPDFQVNTYAEEPQTSPALASNSDGQAVALWLGLDEEHASAVHAQRYQLPGADFAAVGSELVLANYLGLEDTSAAAAVDANRNFVVVWQSYGEDGSGLSILRRRLDPVGNPIGGAIVVNTTTAGNQSNPDVAMDAAGNSVVVWESADQDGDGHGIFAQRFDAAGNPVGPEFQINSTTLGNQTQPAVAMNSATGDFVVVWQSPDDSLEGIYGQRFDAAGNMVGDEFPVNSKTYLDQVSPAVSMNAAGQFAVAWVSDHRVEFDPEDSEKSIFVQWFDANGNSNGDEQLVHTIISEYEAQEYPDVALDASGNMIVVWQSITQDGSAWGVFGRQLLADKTPVQPAEFQINQTTAENQRRATVVADPAGNFTVSWQSDLQDQSATAIISRQYNSDGTPETDEMLVNTWEIGPQILPVMAMTPAGDYGIFWSGQGNARTEGIHGRIYQEGYVPPPPHIEVTPIVDGQQYFIGEATGLAPSFPAVAVVENTGDYVAAWTSFEQPEGDESGLGVYARTFLADGTPSGEAFLVNSTYTTDDQTNPAVAADENGNFIVVWQSLYQDGDGFGIYAQRYEADGTAIGGPFQVNVFTAGDQAFPTVAMDNAGNFVIAWQSEGQDGDGLGIFARTYDFNGTALEEQEFLVNTATAGNQSVPTAARAREDGRFVIGWQSEVVGEEGEIDVNVLAHLYDAEGGTLLDEFTVNTILAHDEVGPRAAMGPSGDFVFAWTTEGQMGSGADVYARQFDALGDGLDDDFRVNDTTQQAQQYPALGIDADGNFIVSWQSGHQDGFSWGIYGKVYDASGDVLVDEFQVNTNVQGPQTNPALNANSQGDAVVVWLGLDVAHQPAVHAQRYLLPQGESEFTVGPEGEVVLSNYVALEEAPAAAAVDAGGNYVAVWQSYGEDGSGLGVYGRRFDPAGEPLGDRFLVNTTTPGNQGQPDVAVDAAGNFTVVWEAENQDGDGYGVFAKRYNAAGAAVSGEIQVNTTVGGDQGMPSIAIDADTGTSIIVWQGPDGSGLGIFGQRYDAAGNPVGGEFRLNHFTDLDQVAPTVAMNANGEYVVGWVSDHRAVFDPTDTEKSIFVQWYDAAGNSVGDEVLVHSIQPEFEAQEHPDVAIDAAGNFVMVWQSINQDGNTWGVFGRQFFNDKSPVQPIEFQVNQTVLAPQRNPSVAADAEGNFVVSWQSNKQDASGPGVFARVYDAAAVAQTDEFLVPTWDQGPQTSPVIAMVDIGQFGIFWTGHGTDRVEGVHAQIYRSALEPPLELRFDLNYYNNATAAGFIGLGTANAYNPALGYGWQTTAPSYSSFESNALLADFHYGTAPNAFLVDLANGDYVVNVTMGFAYLAFDNVNVGAEGMPQLTGLGAAAGQYLHRSFTVHVGDGQLNLQFTDTGGSLLFFPVNAIEIRTAPADPITINGPGSQPADGTSIDVYNGSGAAAGSLVTVTTDLGAITTPDADARYAGVQVLSDNNGDFSFSVRRPVPSGTAHLRAEQVNGAAAGTLDQVYTAAAALRFDLNYYNNATAAGFIGLGTANAYNPALGYGWQTTAPSYSSFESNALLADFHYGTASNTFHVNVMPGASYLVTARFRYAFPISGFDIAPEGGALVDEVNVPANTTTTEVFTASDNGDGILDISFNTDGSPYFIINALEFVKQPLEAAVAPAANPTTELLGQLQLSPIVAEAISRWSNVLPNAAQALAGVDVQIANLPGGNLGLAADHTIVIDADAAGYGWFVDATPKDDVEFDAAGSAIASGAVGRFDLLTVVMHELGHVLGYDDLDPAAAGDALMNGDLPLGTRRTLPPAHVDAVLAATPANGRASAVGSTNSAENEAYRALLDAASRPAHRIAHDRIFAWLGRYLDDE